MLQAEKQVISTVYAFSQFSLLYRPTKGTQFSSPADCLIILSNIY